MVVLLPNLDVSRETEARLRAHESLVHHWSPRINLVATADLPNLWARHIIDSAQLLLLAPTGKQRRLWLDLGSGGGFPGIVLACLLAETAPDDRVMLAESDQRKAVFLRMAARELGLTVTVVTDRAESLPPQDADIVTARALAPLDALLPLVERHLARPNGIALLPKGRRAQQEIDQARAHWDFALASHPSMTSDEASILTLGAIARKPGA